MKTFVIAAAAGALSLGLWSVVGVETPAPIAALLRPTPYPGGEAVLKIIFTGENAGAPVLSRLSQVVGLDVNILAGRIDQIAGRPFGVMLVAVTGTQPKLGAAIAASRFSRSCARRALRAS